MVFSNKITDLKFHINGLVSKDTCKYLIKFYEDNKHESLPEGSYKYKYKKRIDDNFLCMNLSKLSVLDDKFKKPFNTARAYISIMIANIYNCFIILILKISKTLAYLY